MNRSVLFLCSLFLLTSATFAQDADEAARPLTVGTAISDALESTDVHRFTLNLPANTFVYAEANQETVDVVVSVFDPANALVGRFDGPGSGPEPFQFEAEAAGDYRIEIAPFEEATGNYTLEVKRAEPVATTPEARVDQLMVGYDNDYTPGGMVAVVQDGELAFAQVYGMANLRYDIPMTTDTRTNIGSTSKQFTAFAIALLEAQGKLSLDDDIRTHIPELPDLGAPVTLRHLLTHTSGYREFLNTIALTGRRLDRGDYIDRQELIDIVQRQPTLQNIPGTEWNYNNTGYGLLAEVVTRVTDQPFPEWMHENVFTPLDMNDTFVRAHALQIIPNSSQGYVAEEGGGFRDATDLGGAMGAGGIYTTLSDLAKWMQNYHTGTLGGKDVIEKMTTRYVLATGDTTGYALGLFIDEMRGLPRYQHGGADVAHRSAFMYFPTLNAGVLTQSNNASFNGNIANEVAEAFFEEHMEPEDTEEPEATTTAEAAAFDPAQYNPEDFDAFAGRYALEEAPNFILTFTREGDELFTQATGQPKFPITPTSDSTFALSVVEASMTFHREADGSVKALTLHQNGDHRANRLEEEAWVPSEEDRAAYTGRYFSEELETFYTIVVQDSNLVLQHRRMDDITLEPTDKDKFNGGFPIAEVTFERDDADAIVGFSVANGRTRGVKFEKQE